MKYAIRQYLVLSLVTGVFLAIYAPAHAANTDGYAWSETAGWINFSPSHGGVTVHDTHLSGYAWAENFGWILMGVESGGPYANTSSTNWGVNRDASGNLSGYAWSEIAGWVNFNPTHSQVAIDPGTGAFEDYAWSESVGWIHFGDPQGLYNVRTEIADAAPAVSTNTPSAISSSGASCGGNVTFDGGLDVTARGVCWSDSPNPTTSDSHTADGSGTGGFTSDITGLDPETTYYVRAYATNSLGTGYGGHQSFTTPGESSTTKAIIVAGGGPYAGNNLWEATNMIAGAAYQTLVYQGFSKENIYYLSPAGNTIDADGNGEYDDVAADATNSNLQYAIENWALDADNLFIFMTDHGNKDKFLMRKNEHLHASDLDNWLDKTEAVIPGKVIFVYDACRSGSFLPLLTPVQGKQRILISSTSTGQNALFSDRGVLSFGYFFWSSLLYGDSFYDSFVKAKDGVLLTYNQRQTPLLDANGNGVSNEREDQDIARDISVGDEIVSGYTIPTIGSVSPSATIFDENSILIYANDVEDIDGIRRVWANILPPDYISGSADNPVTTLPTIEFFDVGDNRYEATYDGFSSEGVYHLTIFAVDSAGDISLPKATTIAWQCASLDSTTLSFTAPCLELGGTQLEVTFDYTGEGLAWEVKSFSEITGFSDCSVFDNDFTFIVPCLEYSGTRFEITFKYSGDGVEWEIESYKLKQSADHADYTD